MHLLSGIYHLLLLFLFHPRKFTYLLVVMSIALREE